MSIVLQGSTSGSITLQEPAVAGTTVLSLPATSGTLITTGSSGQSIPKAALPTGSVLQVASAVKTDTQSTSSASWVDIGSLSVTITPTSSSSKIFLLAQVSASFDAGSYGDTYQFMRFVRDSTAIGVGASAGSRTLVTSQTTSSPAMMQTAPLSFLDSPSTTSAITYKVQFFNQQSARTSYINRSGTDTDNFAFARAVSVLTVMEIAA